MSEGSLPPQPSLFPPIPLLYSPPFLFSSLLRPARFSLFLPGYPPFFSFPFMFPPASLLLLFTIPSHVPSPSLSFPPLYSLSNPSHLLFLMFSFPLHSYPSLPAALHPLSSPPLPPFPSPLFPYSSTLPFPFSLPPSSSLLPPPLPKASDILVSSSSSGS